MRVRTMAMAVLAVGTVVFQSGCGFRDNRRIEALEARALEHRLNGEYDQAIADYDSIIAMRPERGRVFNSRGVTNTLAQRHAQAVKDYDSALVLNPGMPTALTNRGRSHFYLGNFEQSARDLSAALVRDTNAFTAVWLHMARRRLGSADTTELARNIARTDSTEWPAPAAAYYLGRISAQQFAESLAVGDPTDRAAKRCGAALFLGEEAMWTHRLDEAKARFEEAKSICKRDETEYMASVAELSRLSAAQ